MLLRHHAACRLPRSLATACGGGGRNLPDAVTTQPPPVERPTLAQTYRASGHMAAGDVFVHLFEWKWRDIATECETVLGPAGFAAVQVSPPQEHSITPSFDWSERYQPVSYSIARSRSGTGAEFADMVTPMQGGGRGHLRGCGHQPHDQLPQSGRRQQRHGLHEVQLSGPVHPVRLPSGVRVTNYQNAANVQDCELLSLPDLNTGLASVRQKIADYLIMLARLGVAGFRIDAAKHIQQVELDDILAIVDSTMTAEGRPIPYYFLEVIGGAGEALAPRDFFGEAYGSGGAADITEFTFVGVGDKFRTSADSTSRSSTRTVRREVSSRRRRGGSCRPTRRWSFCRTTTRSTHCGLSYRDGNVFRLANVWMLAQPYGYPSVLSSYRLRCPVGNSMGPPSDAGGHTNDVTCASSLETAAIGQWVCEHRDPYIRNMVALPPRRRRHRREPLVGQRRQRDRLLARRQGLRRHQPRERRR